MNAAATSHIQVYHLLTGWQVNDAYACLATGVQAAVLAAYATGVYALRRKRRRWPPWRTAAFASGLVVLNICTGGRCSR
ncbi:MAG: cytochrome c oxidase assembly protein [Trebonia sp.]|jgi:cytochrome c oxidase assembly factor CtaG